ncbi:hypothetical protein [Entomobacter blattae]|uniref:Uncharacterized protein n=1 Tax=Entomobacter blattae TaxID=2762277 RepID=A0A7H1NP80_9PROT|nr:hypothetical protein [Entomobacter blattae]QNT77590.1 hypothetical protein JGUZn3_03330 [Entomobacter blattae]
MMVLKQIHVDWINNYINKILIKKKKLSVYRDVVDSDSFVEFYFSSIEDSFFKKWGALPSDEQMYAISCVVRSAFNIDFPEPIIEFKGISLEDVQ